MENSNNVSEMRRLLNESEEAFKLDKTPKNQECYDKNGNFLGWFSRSMATVVCVYAKDKDGDWCILGSERGEDTPDYQGYWNCVCGYLEFNLTLAQNACKELKEETGVDLKEEELSFYGYNDSPSENHQNVTMRFFTFIHDKKAEDFKFSHAGNEGKEVGEIKFIKMKDVDKYKWAFGHEKLIKEIFEKK